MGTLHRQHCHKLNVAPPESHPRCKSQVSTQAHLQALRLLDHRLVDLRVAVPHAHSHNARKGLRGRGEGGGDCEEGMDGTRSMQQQQPLKPPGD